MPFIYKLTNNAAEVLKATAEQKQKALEAVGIQAEGDVKAEITDVGAVDTGRLRSSIAHQVDGDSVEVGTNVDYAIYVHEGTGKYAIGGGTPKERWVYRDPATGEFRMGYPQKPRRFIKNAIERGLKDYAEIIKEYLRK
nr:MAG TPA: putative tail component [Caudoviricetes sp.]